MPAVTFMSHRTTWGTTCAYVHTSIWARARGLKHALGRIGSHARWATNCQCSSRFNDAPQVPSDITSVVLTHTSDCVDVCCSPQCAQTNLFETHCPRQDGRIARSRLCGALYLILVRERGGGITDSSRDSQIRPEGGESPRSPRFEPSMISKQARSVAGASSPMRRALRIHRERAQRKPRARVRNPKSDELERTHRNHILNDGKRPRALRSEPEKASHGRVIEPSRC